VGSGFKDYTAGEVLTAADVDGYLMRQAVMTFADATARNTALSGVLDEGMAAYLEGTDILTIYSGAAWYEIGPFGAWSSYTPVLTASSSNPTLGSGSSATGRYQRLGRRVTFEAQITFGTSGTATGSGTYRVSVPATIDSAWWGHTIGNAVLIDTGTPYPRSVSVGADGTYVEMYSEASAAVTHAVPFSWAASDIIRITGTYEAAA
jgi:hypothetical protein